MPVVNLLSINRKKYSSLKRCQIRTVDLRLNQISKITLTAILAAEVVETIRAIGAPPKSPLGSLYGAPPDP